MEPTQESDSRHQLDPDDVQELLAQVGLVQSQVRWSLLSGNWWLFLLWGIIILGSLVPSLFLETDNGWYWIVVGPLGALLSFGIGYRVSHKIGTTASGWPYVLTGLAIFAGTWGSSILLSDRAAITGVFISLALGFSVFALLDRQYGPISIFLFLIVLSVALFTEIDESLFLYSVNAVAFGMAFVALGLGLRVGRPKVVGRRGETS